MATITLTGGLVLTYSGATHGTSPAAQYSAWCSAAGVSDTTTLQAIDDDDYAFNLTLQSPFFATGPGKAFISTEGGLGLFAGTPYDTDSGSYAAASLPGVSRFYGTKSKPIFAITYHAGTGDLKSAGGKVQKSGNTTLIFAQHSQFDDDAINRYDFAAKITPQSIELVGTTVDVSTSVMITEWVENADFGNTDYSQQVTVQTQSSGTTYKYTFTLPSGDPEARVSAATLLGAVSAVATVAPAAQSSAPGMLGAVSVMAMSPMFASAAAASPLGAVHALSYHDFTDQLGDAITRYVMDLTTPGGLVRVPISSWQATLQTGGSNYVQCVVPAALQWVASINEATEFTITRTATPAGGAAVEYEMAAAPLGQIQIANGPTNYTATLSGYSTAFAADEAPDAAYDRTLAGVRSINSGTGGYRVRCAIDWLLRPGQRAIVGAESFVVGYINYYATSGNDRYMDVGSA